MSRNELVGLFLCLSACDIGNELRARATEPAEGEDPATIAHLVPAPGYEPEAELTEVDTDTYEDTDVDTDTYEDTDVEKDCEDIQDIIDEQECCPDCPDATCEDTKYLDCCPDCPEPTCETLNELECPATCEDLPEGTECGCPAAPPPENRMTGGGVVYLGDRRSDGIVSHGFQLRCDPDDERQNLEVNWFHTANESHQFHLLDLTSASCIDEGEETPPSAGFTTFIGEGTGSCDEDTEGRVEFTFKDFGEPGREDELEVRVFCTERGEEEEVLEVLLGEYSKITGNHQAH
ncbi:MAG: hypothetical protein Q8P18_29955 [Pseudomonadota bacterium]|nr:hypothetical protein [Pseudomonadota bacterium]